MQHITNAEKSLLVGDVVTGLLLEYAALIAKLGSGDTVKVRAVSGDGNEIVANFLLNSGTVLMAESTSSNLVEPDNGEAETYLRDRLDSYGDGSAQLISLGDDGRQATQH